MNKKLLQQAALDCLKQYEFVEATAPIASGQAAWLALAFSRLDERLALHWLKTAIQRQGNYSQPAAASHVSEFSPVYGWILGHLHQTSKNKPAFLQEIRPLYSEIIGLHRVIYANFDLSGDGLIATEGPGSVGLTSHYLHAPPLNGLEDPFFNAMLIWSNEHLIRIGGLLREDVQEIIEWNDLAIWSMNEKLWDENAGGYLPYDLNRESTTEEISINSFLPLAAGIPTQEQAEMMHETLVKKALSANAWTLNWLLYKGLLRYEMRETAVDLKRETLAAALSYPADTPEKAAVVLEWLCANR
ncbi:MAG: hypothetical protein HUU01_09285 [Saprospiraceae bacterium]|nr:hypothetical protein [Saprospiraceae bacterium]